ncbi:Ribonuclease H [Abeliophyllum distichum]|uniref:Ribonuclease H n=1 Tax=Abeliophyllum distichum TaxID=126358 RepID=A0ABD1Q6K2_9LAMI
MKFSTLCGVAKIRGNQTEAKVLLHERATKYSKAHKKSSAIGNTIEVSVDDMLVKSTNAEDHIGHLREMFRILYKYYMKIKALIDMRSPSSPKEVQSLIGRLGSPELIYIKESKLKNGETLLIYLALSEKAVSSVLMCEEGPVQLLVYYVSKALQDAETSQFDISYKPMPSVKGQALADFVAKFAHIPEDLLEAQPQEDTNMENYMLMDPQTRPEIEPGFY